MKKNQIIRNNATGETLTMLVSDEDNSGARQLYEVRLPPHRPGPPLHYHVDFIETFTVKQGQLDVYVDKDQKHLLLQPGESATAHLRQPHRFANDHDEPVTFIIETKPAGGVVKAFQLAYGIANDGGAARDGLPKNPIAEVRVFQDHARLPTRYPPSNSANCLRLCRLISKSRRAGEKMAGLFRIAGCWQIGEPMLAGSADPERVVGNLEIGIWFRLFRPTTVCETVVAL